jgi:hypothetical protein
MRHTQINIKPPYNGGKHDVFHRYNIFSYLNYTIGAIKPQKFFLFQYSKDICSLFITNRVSGDIPRRHHMLLHNIFFLKRCMFRLP